jgi:PAS domain S-box-containing protein
VSEVIHSIITGKVDAMFGRSSLLYTSKLLGSPYLKLTVPLDTKLDLVFAVNKKFPLAVTIINKALKHIGKKKLLKFQDKWFLLPGNAGNIDLTQAEKEYLQKNNVTYAGDPNWLPFEAFDKSDNYIGIIADHIDIIENRLNIKFEKVITKNWLDTLKLSKTKKVDVISGDAADTVLNQNYKPIDTYIKNPLVIVTDKDHEYILDLNHIEDHKIAFVSGYGYSADITKKYPDIKFLKCETIQSGLLGVKTGKYDAFIGSLAMVEYTIVTMGIEDIKIAGQTDIVMKVTLFVDKNKPLLYSILNKAMKTISENRQHDIISKWRKNKVESMFDTTLIWQLLTLSLILLLTGLIFVYLLKRSNRRLNELLDSTIEGVLISKKGICRTSNQTTLDIFGYSNVDEIKGRHMLDFVAEESKELLKKQIKSTTVPYEAVMKKKDGSLFPALIKGVDLSDGKTRISTIIDLTKLKETEEENLYLAERIKLAFDGSRDGLWDLNLIDNSVYFSARWKEMLGYTDDELENNFDTWQSRVHPDDLENVLHDIELSMHDKEGMFENKHRLRHKDGHWVWIYDRGKVQHDKDGKAIRLIGTHTDLTTEINLSNELSELNENLEVRVKEQVDELESQHMFIAQQRKLASMGEMLSIIAHQWRQPLNSINSNVAVIGSVLAKETIDQKILQEQMEKIENNTQYMSDTIEGFSNFFRPNKPKKEFNLQDTIKSALELLTPRSNDIEINIMYNQEIELCTFKEEYQQVIMIILNNAIDNFESKRVEDPKIDIVIAEDTDMSYLSICDNGGGIDKDKIDHIFDPYFTTKFSKEGVGLGLYIAKMLIEDSMPGLLEAKNTKDGICFEITVPKGVADA